MLRSQPSLHTRDSQAPAVVKAPQTPLRRVLRRKVGNLLTTLRLPELLLPRFARAG